MPNSEFGIKTIPHSEFISSYGTKEVLFKFRGRSYSFSLSQELFSSADIDTGSRFLLKVFSNFLNNNEWLPSLILDAGCGVGVLGICAAGTLRELKPASGIRVRAQDRDELARLFTDYNARRNGLPDEMLSAHTEPLLSGPIALQYDLILTNIPAKAGRPVLEDFIQRSVKLLAKDGRAFLVAVNTLAHFFRTRIAEAASLLNEETGKEHTVFVYGPVVSGAEHPSCGPLVFDENFPHSYPFYIRNQYKYKMEEIPYRLDTVYGAPDFDSPGSAAQAAAALTVKAGLVPKLWEDVISPGETPRGTALLIHDAGQGHFALWLAGFLSSFKPAAGFCGAGVFHWVFSGRNIVALGAARSAFAAAINTRDDGSSASPFQALPSIIPAVDIFLDRERIRADGNGFTLIAYFPESMPDIEAAWKGLTALAAPGGMMITGMPSAEAERFDRKKPSAFIRNGDVRRNGFRALAYQMKETCPAISR